MDLAFAVHMLNDAGKQKASKIAAAFDGLWTDLQELTGVDMPTREMSLVRTKLEEACFFAKKAMANQEENQQQQAESEL